MLKHNEPLKWWDSGLVRSASWYNLMSKIEHNDSHWGSLKHEPGWPVPAPLTQSFCSNIHLDKNKLLQGGSLQQYYSRYDILCHVSQEYQHHSCTSSSVSPYWVDTPVHSTVVSWPQCQVTHVSLEYSDPSPGCGDNTGHHQHHASCQTILNTLHTTLLTQLFMSWVKLSVTPILLGTTFSASMVQL